MVEHLQLWLWHGFKIQVGTFRVGSDFISCCVSFFGDQIWLMPMSEGWVVWVLHFGYIQGSSKQQQSQFFSTTKQIMKHILTYCTHFNPWILCIYVGIWWYMMVYDGIWWYIYRRYMYDLCIEKQKTLMHHTSSSHDKLQRAAKWPMPREYWTTPAIDVSIRCRWSLDFEVLNGTN